MCSADYDGDQGRLGSKSGVRNADPNMKLSIGGLFRFDVDYLKAMKFWADIHRKGSFPADILNFHHYCSDGTEEQAFKTTGISPESDKFKEKVEELVRWRDANLPDKEIWITEFGYDTNPQSPLHAPVIAKMTPEEVQGALLIRCYMALAAAGVDRAAMFMFRDVNSKGSGPFETSGLVTEKGKWEPKPSYYYVSTLKKRLAGMRFVKEEASGASDVMIYRFESDDSRRVAKVVWRISTRNDSTESIVMKATNGASSLITFSDKKTNGIEEPLAIRNGTVRVKINETPVIAYFK